MHDRMEEKGIKSCLKSKPPSVNTREWSGRLRERVKRENLDLQQSSGDDLDLLETQSVSGQEAHFSLGPRAGTDLQHSRKILERALSRPRLVLRTPPKVTHPHPVWVTCAGRSTLLRCRGG